MPGFSRGIEKTSHLVKGKIVVMWRPNNVAPAHTACIRVFDCGVLDSALGTVLRAVPNLWFMTNGAGDSMIEGAG